MAIGTTFGEIHSNSDLGLIQQSVEVSPAKPRTEYVDIPGANGSIDFTETFGLHYEDREIKWTFALYPGADWSAKRTEVSNAINGKHMNIILDEDSDYYYEGRVVVDSYKRDKMLHQITVKARVFPFKRENEETVETRDDLTPNYKQMHLECGEERVAPVIEISEETILTLGETSITLSAGTHEASGLILEPGDNLLRVKTTGAETGEITITYRKGEL